MDNKRWEERPFPWHVFVLALEIGVLLIIAIIWAVQLFRRGRKLKGKIDFDGNSEEKWEVQTGQDKNKERGLLRKAKEFYRAKLSYDDEDINQKQESLEEHLATDYERFKRGDPDNARRQMILKIRTNLVQNPYDHVGRHMASEVKKIFVQQVLKEATWINKLQRILRIPSCLKRKEKAKKILLLIPVMLAVWGTAQKGFFYLYDIYTDVKVINELKDIPDITMPKIPKNKIGKFLLEDIKEKGILALRRPCEALDVLEEIPNQVIPFYKQTIGDIGNVHWNPTRKSNYTLSDAFKITTKLGNIYKSAMNHIRAMKYKRGRSGLDISKPSDIYKLHKKIRGILSKAKDELQNANSGFTGLMVAIFSDVDIHQYLPSIKKAIEVLDDLERDVLNDDLVRHVLRKGDKVYEKREFSKTTYPEMASVFSSEIYEKLKKTDQLTTREDRIFNSTEQEDVWAKELNDSQIECRRFTSQLFKLAENEQISEWAVHYFTSNKSENSAEGIAKNINAKTKFLTQNIIRSVLLFLVLNMGWTLLVELKSTFLDFWYAQHIPLISNFRMICQENNPNSPLLDGGGNSSNDYVVKSSQRHSINILEATQETVSAINVQIALWVYMSTFIADTRRVFKDTFDINVTNSMIGLSDNSFTDFNSSAIMSSLVAGIFSLTFAQYKQYMTRHERDAEFSGKIVYFLACVSNSFAIFLSQIGYFTIGLPSFICILIYVIRLIVNFDKYDVMPDSDTGVIVFLVLTVVILPLKLFPIKFAELLKFLTERFFLHKTYHINKQNRSGYDVPGFETALYMFLPSSHNNLSHINNQESFANPGFFYFSKDPLSKELYRLRFETQLFCKVLMHTFYLAFSFVFLNILHLLLLSSTVLSNDYWVSKLHRQDMWHGVIGNILFSFRKLLPPQRLA